MQYEARPVKVDAHIIIGVGPVMGDGTMCVTLQNGYNEILDKGMIARHIPRPGDYWVVQADGYIYINPKDVFERKYAPVATA